MKKYLFIMCSLCCSYVNAQIHNSSLLKRAKEEFSSSNYVEVLALSKQFYIQHPSVDSLYYEMKRWEYRSYNMMGQPDVAKQILKSIINSGNESAYINVSNASRHYRYYLAISDPQEDIITYENAVRGILCKENIYFTYKDYKYYLKLLQYKYGGLPYNLKLDAFRKEDIIVEDYNKAYLKAYYNFAKGCIILDGEWNSVGGYCKDHIQIIKACSFLRIANKLFQDDRDRDECIIKYHDESLAKIVEAYSEVAQYGAAAFYYKKKLDLLYENWQNWSRRSPWESGGGYYVMHEFTAYEEYVELLYDSSQYVEIINYTNSILNDTLFVDYKNTYTGYLNYHIQRAKVKLGEHKSPDIMYMNRYGQYYDKNRIENLYVSPRGKNIPIEDVIEQYLKGELTIDEQMIRWGSYFPYLDFYKFLISRGDYKELISITDTILKIFYDGEDYSADPLAYYFEEKCPYEITEYDRKVAAGRELWHHANGGSLIWLTYKYRAIAYEKLGDYHKAIENQVICVDNVRTDWKFEPDERENIFSYSWGNCRYNLYTDVENEELFSLAEYYRLIGDYENSAICYRRALALNRDILSKFLKATSWDEKVKQWDKTNKIYKQIIRNDDIVKNPYFSDIVFECSSILKSFLLNIKLNEHAAIDADDSYHTKTLWEEKLWIDKRVEREHFLDNVISNSFLDAIEIGAELEDVISIEELLPSEHILLDVKNNLDPNEILVDFFITFECPLEYKDTNINEWKTTVCQEISACVIRGSWNKPKIVPIDGLADFLTSYFLPQESMKANNSVEFGKTIWGKILNVSEAAPGDVIYFLPTGVLNQVSLENLLIDKGQYISDIYELYRLTSYRQILHPSENISGDDKWALFASREAVYSERVGTRCNTEYQNLCNLELKDLNELPGAGRTMDYIDKKEKYNSLSKYYSDFNEVEFAKLSMNSPQVIYIGSHGFYLSSGLNPSDSLYLFGMNRTIRLPKEEISMYKSGIVMNRVPEYYTTMSDGFLTSKEISLLDLSTTKLACVSACSTGLGAITTEGVYGLQRGFKLAGVQSLLVSLWDVDDKATEILIKSFYDNLRKGFNKYTSLKNAQMEVRKYEEYDNGAINLGEPYQYADPYYWAGFVLIDGNE